MPCSPRSPSKQADDYPANSPTTNLHRLPHIPSVSARATAPPLDSGYSCNSSPSPSTSALSNNLISTSTHRRTHHRSAACWVRTALSCQFLRPRRSSPCLRSSRGQRGTPGRVCQGRFGCWDGFYSHTRAWHCCNADVWGFLGLGRRCVCGRLGSHLFAEQWVCVQTHEL